MTNNMYQPSPATVAFGGAVRVRVKAVPVDVAVKATPIKRLFMWFEWVTNPSKDSGARCVSVLMSQDQKKQSNTY
jgi:hypothetical protein